MAHEVPADEIMVALKQAEDLLSMRPVDILKVVDMLNRARSGVTENLTLNKFESALNELVSRFNFQDDYSDPFYQEQARLISALKGRINHWLNVTPEYRKSQEGAEPRSQSSASAPRQWPDGAPPPGEVPPPQVPGDQTLQRDDDSVPITMIERPQRPSEVDTEPIPAPDGEGHTEKIPSPESSDQDANTMPISNDPIDDLFFEANRNVPIRNAVFLGEVESASRARLWRGTKSIAQAGGVVGGLIAAISVVFFLAYMADGTFGQRKPEPLLTLADVSEPTLDPPKDPEDAPAVDTEPPQDPPKDPEDAPAMENEAPEALVPMLPKPEPVTLPEMPPIAVKDAEQPLPPEPIVVPVAGLVDCSGTDARLTQSSAVFTRQLPGSSRWLYTVGAALQPGEVNGHSGVCVYANGPHAGEPFDVACLLGNGHECPPVTRM